MLHLVEFYGEAQALVPVCVPTFDVEFNFVREVNTDACEDDTTDLLDMIYNVVDMFLNGDIDPVKIVLWLTEAFDDGKKMATECEDPLSVFEGMEDEYFKKFEVVDQAQCHTTLDKTYDTGFDLYTSFVNEDWTRVIIDVTSLYSEVQDVLAFCVPATVEIDVEILLPFFEPTF